MTTSRPPAGPAGPPEVEELPPLPGRRAPALAQHGQGLPSRPRGLHRLLRSPLRRRLGLGPASTALDSGGSWASCSAAAWPSAPRPAPSPRCAASIATCRRITAWRRTRCVPPASPSSTSGCRFTSTGRRSSRSSPAPRRWRARDDFEALRDLAMLELFYSSGLRLSELQGLNLAALDLLSDQVKVLGKGRKERIVPVGSRAVKALRRYLGAREEVARSGGRGSARGVRGPAGQTAHGAHRPAPGPSPARRRRGGRLAHPLPAPHLRHAHARRRAPTSGPSRNSWGTPASARPRSTLTPAWSGSSRSTARPPEGVGLT